MRFPCPGLAGAPRCGPQFHRPTTEFLCAGEGERERRKRCRFFREILCNVEGDKRNDRSRGRGSLAGFSTGVYCVAPDKMVLVPHGMKIIEPADTVTDTTIWKLFEQMLRNDVEEPMQFESFMGMLKGWYISLRDREFEPAQAIVLCGPEDCGKTFVQEFIITPLLGGNEADPFSYLSGITAFTGDLFNAEHLRTSDAGGSLNDKERRIEGFWCNPKPAIFSRFPSKPAFRERIDKAKPSFIRQLLDYPPREDDCSPPDRLLRVPDPGRTLDGNRGRA